MLARSWAKKFCVATRCVRSVPWPSNVEVCMYKFWQSTWERLSHCTRALSTCCTAALFRSSESNIARTLAVSFTVIDNCGESFVEKWLVQHVVNGRELLCGYRWEGVGGARETLWTSRIWGSTFLRTNSQGLLFMYGKLIFFFHYFYGRACSFNIFKSASVTGLGCLWQCFFWNQTPLSRFS